MAGRTSSQLKKPSYHGQSRTTWENERRCPEPSRGDAKAGVINTTGFSQTSNDSMTIGSHLSRWCLSHLVHIEWTNGPWASYCSTVFPRLQVEIHCMVYVPLLIIPSVSDALLNEGDLFKSDFMMPGIVLPFHIVWAYVLGARSQGNKFCLKICRVRRKNFMQEK